MSRWGQRPLAALSDGVERYRIQTIPEAMGGLDPHVQRGPAAGRCARDSGQGYAPFHGGDNIRQGDVLGVAGQHMAPGYAPDAFDNAPALQQPHDLLNEFFGYARTGRQFRSRSGRVFTLLGKAQ